MRGYESGRPNSVRAIARELKETVENAHPIPMFGTDEQKLEAAQQFTTWAETWLVPLINELLDKSGDTHVGETITREEFKRLNEKLKGATQ